MLPKLEAAVQQKLHPKANPQQRGALGGRGLHNGVQTGLPQAVRRVAEGAHSGQDHPVGGEQDLRVRCDHGGGSYGLKRALQGEQVAHAVVYDSDHYSTPLVEGTAPGKRGSMATA